MCVIGMPCMLVILHCCIKNIYTRIGIVNYFVTASTRTGKIKEVMTYLTSSIHGTIKIQRENNQIFQAAGHINEASSFDRTDR